MGRIDHIETEIQLSNQRKRFFWIIAIITLICIGFLTSTTVLALKVRGSYPSARIEFHVWSHQEALQGTRNFATFKVPENATVFTLMEHALGEGGSQFRYDYKQFEFGKYITSYGGTRESVAENLYWMLYKLTDSPNANSPPSKDMMPELGVDDIRIQDGEVYLFWLTKMEFTKGANLGAVSQPCVNGRIN